jgi:hypothetical protein
MRGRGRPEDWILNIGSDRVCATRRMQWQTVATAVCGSATEQLRVHFEDTPNPKPIGDSRRYRRRLR